MTQEHFPEFFEQAPTLTVQDALAEFLGAAEEGIMQYRYADAVRLCGHSCPTVAGAYLMTLKGLKALYGSDLPQRGGIEAAMQGARDEGTVGVSLNAAMQPFAPEMRDIMPKAVSGTASAEELKRFGELWQARVKAFLIDLADDPQFVVVREI